MNSFDNIFDLLIGAYGVYFLYLVARVKFQNQPLSTKSFLPRDLTPENCKDFDGFTAFMVPHLFLMGAILALYGILTYFVGLFENYRFIASSVVILGFLVYYAILLKTIRKRFW